MNSSNLPTKGRKQRESTNVALNGNLLRRDKVEAVLKGFHAGYTDSDHHVLDLEVDLDVTNVNTSANTVTVAADYLLRDSSGNIDDRFDGFVQEVVIAEVA